MTRENYRMIGAITGLTMGLIVMWQLGLGGLIYAAMFGAGGTVAGGVTGERLFDRRDRRSVKDHQQLRDRR